MSEENKTAMQLVVLFIFVLILLALVLYEKRYGEEPIVINQEKVDCFELDSEMYCKLSKP